MLCVSISCRSPGGERPRLTVFAAASLQDVLTAVGDHWSASNGAALTFNFAGSNVLARQLEAAPRADVFVSADSHWIQRLERAGVTIPDSARAVFSNRLVLVARHDAKGYPPQVTVDDLPSLAFRHLAVADPTAVPAGRYARAALDLGRPDGSNLWTELQPRVVPTADVRAALGLVKSDPKILAIVYQTDALSSPAVRVLCEVPVSSNQPIAYTAALISGRSQTDLARRFIESLTEPFAVAILERHGFLPSLRATS